MLDDVATVVESLSTWSAILDCSNEPLVCPRFEGVVADTHNGSYILTGQIGSVHGHFIEEACLVNVMS